MFSNNNYLPDLNHYPSAGQQLPSIPPSPQPPDPLPVIPGSSNYARSGNFRFLSPTQGTAVPTWVPPACAVGMATAPGVGANWQHSVPTTLPWANHVPPRFTAQNSLSQSLPVYTMPVAINPQTTMMQVTPKPSIRSLRLKRRFHPSSAEELDGPSSKRYLSEKMANWFKQLQISPATEQSKTTLQPSGSDAVPGTTNLDNGWQRFHEVEKRLEVDLEEDELDEAVLAAVNGGQGSVRGGRSAQQGMSRLWENGTVLTIPEEVKKEVENPNLALPAQIMKTITKPCMDLVLWKPPEVLVSNSSLCSAPCLHHMNSCTTTASTHTPLHLSAATATRLSQSVSQPSSFPVSGDTVFSSGRLSRSSSRATDLEMMDSTDMDMDL